MHYLCEMNEYDQNILKFPIDQYGEQRPTFFGRRDSGMSPR